MLALIISIGVILIIAILLTIFRVHRLVNVARGADKKIATTGNKINGLLFLLILIGGFALFFWYSSYAFDDYAIPVASEHGVQVDTLFWVTTAITGFIFLLTHVLLFYFSYRYQYHENTTALFYPDNSKLEVIWTIVPAIVLAILVFTGWQAWTDITSKSPDNAEVIEILGYQFTWEARYPGEDGELGDTDYKLIDAQNSFGMDFTDKSSFDDYTSRTVHVPKGKPVLFKIRARDVLHSVFIPEMRLKQDAVPGMPTRFWFVPEKTTEEMREETGNPDFNYNIYCAEVCGRGHFSMQVRLVVQEPEAYEEWKAEQDSWLSGHSDYLAKVPSNLKEVAMIQSGLEREDNPEKSQK